jgi:hypothetical protein
MSLTLSGQLPKLHYPPPIFDKTVKTVEAKTTAKGNILVITGTVDDYNATGSSIATGSANMLAVAGFADMAWRKNEKLLADSFAFGWKSFCVNGHNKGSESYGMAVASKVVSGGKVVAQALPEIKAFGEFAIVLNLHDEISLTDFDALLFKKMRLSGGNLSNVKTQLFIDVSTASHVLSEYAFVADSSEDLIVEAHHRDRLDALLEKISSGDSTNTVAVVGYQAIEPPRPRIGTRSQEDRHVFASGIITLAKWQKLDRNCFWSTKWQKKTYSAIVSKM